jgi:hypothetical protein
VANAMSESKRNEGRPATDRQDRLASALRANLRRRKEQARGREAVSTPDESDEGKDRA